MDGEPLLPGPSDEVRRHDALARIVHALDVPESLLQPSDDLEELWVAPRSWGPDDEVCPHCRNTPTRRTDQFGNGVNDYTCLECGSTGHVPKGTT